MMYIFRYLQTSQQGLICTSQMQHMLEAAGKKIIITITYVHVFQYLNQNLRDSDYCMFWGFFPMFQNCENGINV